MPEGVESESRYGVLDFPCGAERLANGNTLIADAGDEQQRGSEILEVDRNGQIVWSYSRDLLFAHSTQKLRNGDILITDTTHNRVLEITPEKDIVLDSDSWGAGTGRLSDGSKLDYPNDAHELEDGTLLVTDRNNNRCVIVDKLGQVLWQYGEHLRHPHNADPLPNGNIIVADSDRNRVIEVNRAKQVVWTYGDREGNERLYWPRDADRMGNGNTLICDSKNSRILEVDRAGRTVWRFALPYFANLYDVDPLPNGNLLVVDQQHQRVIEIDRFGNIIWEFRNYWPALPVHPRLTNGSLKDRDGSVPSGWNLMTRIAEGGGRLIWDTDERGRSCVGLEFDRSGAVALMQVVAVKAGGRYRFAARLRAEGLEEGCFACLQLAYRDQYHGWFEDILDSPKGQLLEGSTGWLEDTIETVAPDGATSVEVRILIVGKGRVWARQVMMVEA